MKKKLGILMVLAILFGISCNDESPSGNQPPVINTIPDKVTTMNKSVPPFDIIVTDPDTDMGQVVLTALSQDQSLLPDANIEISGTGTSRPTVITPETDQTGVVIIEVTADDGQAQSKQSFQVTVNPAISTWQTQNSGSANHLNTVYFLDDTIGWAVGSQETILKTVNGGDDWITMTPPNLMQDLKAVAFRGAYYGWIVGHFTEGTEITGKVLFSNDGGASWEAQIDFEEPLNAVYASQTSMTWITGEKGIVTATANNGQTWVKTNLEGAEDLNSIFFVDENLGWVAGDNTTVYVTDDAGDTWIRLLTNGPFDINAIFFIDEFTGWACGNFNSIIKTVNGGLTWLDFKPSVGFPEDDWKAIYFVDEQNGWLIGQNGRVFKSTDGGSSWNYDGNNSVVNNLAGLIMLDEYTGYIVGAEGTIMKYKP